MIHDYILHVKSFFGLLLGHEEGVEHGNTRRYHSNFKIMLFLEVINEFLHGNIAFNVETIPQTEFMTIVFELWSTDRFRETKEW